MQLADFTNADPFEIDFPPDAYTEHEIDELIAEAGVNPKRTHYLRSFGFGCKHRSLDAITDHTCLACGDGQLEGE